MVSAIGVLRIGSGLAPAPVRRIALPRGAAALGETLTRDGRYLLAASGSGAVVIDVARAEQGRPGAVLGTLSAPRANGAIEVAVSASGDFAFVSEEGSADAAVFNLRRALTRGFGASDYVGSIPLGIAPVGLAVSPDGRWLYATSEIASRPHPGGLGGRGGTLSVIDLRRAQTRPASSVIAVAAAGCGPVRVITSADGRAVWVDARESDDLLCFSAARLRSAPRGALAAVVRVGEAPVGLALVRGGTRVVVADSNRFGAPGAAADLGVVNVAAALAGRPSFVGRIPAGQFPREMALTPGGGVLVVTNFASQQLEAVSVPTIP
jgi:DNA-binding beta-propeller fold protein YncE